MDWFRRLLVRSGLPAGTALFIAVTGGLLPSFHQMPTWATIFTSSWLHLLGGIGGARYLRWADDRRRRDLVIAVVSLTVTMLSYPPAAMFCWIVPVVRFSIERPPPREAALRTLGLAATVAASTVAGASLLGIAGRLFDLQRTDHLRVVSSLDALADKAVWFVTRPVLIAARPFNTWSPSPIEAALTALPVIGIVVLALWARATGSVGRRTLSTAVIGICTALTMSSHLVAPDNQVEYRFMTGITLAVWALFVIAVREMAERTPLGSRPRSPGWATRRLAGGTAMVLVVVLAGSEARASVDRLMVSPSRDKEAYLRSAVSTFDPTAHREVAIVLPESWPSTRRLGVFSTVTDLSHPWVAEPNVRLLLAENGHDVSSLPVRTTERSTPQPSILVVDLRPFAEALSGATAERP